MKEAIVLAGGFGTRLQSVVSDVPKPMAPVAGRPFLTYVLDRLGRQGYDHVVLATGYLHEKVEAFFGKEYQGIAIDYARELSPLGTGGAMVNALQHCHGEKVTVLNGDTLFDIDHNSLIDFAEEKHTRLAIVLRKVEDAGRYGSVEIDGDGRITAFREKDPASGAGFINGGIYRVSRSLFDGYGVGQPFSFEKELMQQRFHDEKYYAYADGAYFIDIGIPDDYRRAQTELTAL
ncbi:MAG: nucleotidyltransferase family protein [Bacteroidales bacterium]|nr:nucleotidyltransferase family protein [Bacteroidales bacterium]